MCGICGIVGGADRETLGRMMNALRHRGPDEEGVHVDQPGEAALGHVRLSIIDRARGRQPLFNEDGSLCIVCNGEIYNYRELRRELSAKGHRFSTESDTEAVLHLYEEEGDRVPERLQGMFAFAVWDAKRRELFLARDRLGIKPLFCAQRGGRFLFASELKGILAAPDQPREIDPTALGQYLTFMYVPAPLTMVKGVFKLPAAHTATLRGGGAQLRRYWQPPDAASPTRRSLRAEAGELRELLREAVVCRLMSEVPLGTYLSGGLDSSLVVALMSQASPAPDTFSVGFDEAGFDETPHAERVARRFGTKHRRLVCRSAAEERLERIFWHLDEPVADAAALPTFLMAEATKPLATVVLTGEGADELFAGYSHYKILAAASGFGRWVPAPDWSWWRKGSAPAERAAAFAAAAGSPADAYLALKCVFTEDEKARLTPPSMRPPEGTPTPRDIVASYLEGGGGDPLHCLQRMDLEMYLPDDLLVKVDRMTMAHAVEARVPFLDHRVVERAMRLPSRWKLRGGVSKYLLRYAAEGLLPKENVWRPKKGFGVPVGRWAEREMLASAKGLLGRDGLGRGGLLDPVEVSRLFANKPMDMFRRRQFWTLFTLEMWRRTVLGT